MTDDPFSTSINYVCIAQMDTSHSVILILSMDFPHMAYGQHNYLNNYTAVSSQMHRKTFVGDRGVWVCVCVGG